MNWKCHIKNICKKIAFAFSAIKQIRHLIPFSTLINVLVQPYVNYCGQLSGQLWQWSLREASECPKSCSSYCVPVMTLEYRRLVQGTVSVNSNIKDLNQLLLWTRTPEYLSSRFVFRNDITTNRLRHTETINWLFRSPAPIIGRCVSLTAELGYGTACSVTFVHFITWF